MIYRHKNDAILADSGYRFYGREAGSGGRITDIWSVCCVFYKNADVAYSNVKMSDGLCGACLLSREGRPTGYLVNVILTVHTYRARTFILSNVIIRHASYIAIIFVE